MASRLRVVVCDDHDDNRELYADYLRMKNHDVRTARTGREALALAASFRPHAIVMDLSMPDVDGWEATRELRRRPESRDVVIIALTAHAYAGPLEAAVDAGVDACMVKPCLPQDLVDAIEHHAAAR